MAKKLSSVDVVRAWKDASYRNALSAEQRALLPANPAGMVEVDDVELGTIVGGADRIVVKSNAYTACTVRCGPRHGGNSTLAIAGSARLTAAIALAAPPV